MNKLGNIRIRGENSQRAVIDIEGVIGVPEEWQFEDQADRVATYDRFKEQLAVIGALRSPTVRVNIRSVGGSVEDALLIYEALCNLEEVRVETYCHGYVASAATVIAQAGARRFISAGALYLIHNATLAIDGNKEEALRTADMLSKTDRRIAEIYARRSGCPVEQFVELMGRDGGRGEWLSPEETVECGLADEVVEFSVVRNIGSRMKNFARSLGLGVGQLVARVAQAERQSDGIVGSELHGDDLQVSGVCARAELPAEPELRAMVGPSATLPCEDPVLESDGRRASNRDAYAQDVEVFRSTFV